MQIYILAKRFFNEEDQITEYLRKYYEGAIHYWYNRYSKEIDLSKLNSIIIPNDYYENIQLPDGKVIKNHEVHSNDVMAAAKVVNSSNLADKSYHIIYNKDSARYFVDKVAMETYKSWIPSSLIDKFQNNHEKAIHTLHHEFAHVEDNSFVDNMLWYAKAIEDAADEIINLEFLKLSRHIWAEYYATRKSCLTYPQLTQNASLVRQHIIDKENEIVLDYVDNRTVI